MAMIASHHGDVHPKRRELVPQEALRYAWYVWMTLLICPFLLFLYVAWTLTEYSSRRELQFADSWFVGSVAYMVLVVPASFFVRSRLFRNYWKGECVAPAAYLKGMFTVWGALEIGGLLSLAGCLLSKSLLPTLLPALAAFMMFVVLWPSGRAMICHERGSSDDPERYEEPR
jgi:hypothetical protein